MPIFRRLAALFLTLTLAACGGGASLLTEDEVAVRVAGQRVVIAAPEGFCFDRRASDVRSTGAVLLAAACSLTGDAAEAGPPPIGAFIQVTVSNSGLPTGLADLDQFFRDPAAVATLGKSGEAEAVRRLESAIVEDVLFIKVEDGGTQPVPGASGTFWRAFFEAADRLIGLSIVSFRGATVGDATAQELLAAFAARTKAANPQPVPGPVLAEAPSPSAP